MTETKHVPLAIYLGIICIIFSFVLGYVSDVYFWGMMGVGSITYDIIFVYAIYFIPAMIGLAVFNNFAWNLLTKPQPKIEAMPPRQVIWTSMWSLLALIIVSFILFLAIRYFRNIAGEHQLFSPIITYIVIMAMSVIATWIYRWIRKLKQDQEKTDRS